MLVKQITLLIELVEEEKRNKNNEVCDNIKFKTRESHSVCKEQIMLI